MKVAQIDARRQAGYFPYYKIQWRDEVGQVWRDVQKKFATPQEAHRQAPLVLPHPALRYRLMEITERGRNPVHETQ